MNAVFAITSMAVIITVYNVNVVIKMCTAIGEAFDCKIQLRFQCIASRQILFSLLFLNLFCHARGSRPRLVAYAVAAVPTVNWSPES
jgi:hypothetical protein